MIGYVIQLVKLAAASAFAGLIVLRWLGTTDAAAVGCAAYWVTLSLFVK